MHRILVDSDVILDLFLAREPHHSVALRFFSYLDLNSDSVIGHVSPIAIANVAFILTKAQSQSYAVKKILAVRPYVPRRANCDKASAFVGKLAIRNSQRYNDSMSCVAQAATARWRMLCSDHHRG